MVSNVSKIVNNFIVYLLQIKQFPYVESLRVDYFGDMEHLPVEVVGIILSMLKVAQDVIIASSTCSKW